MPYNKQLTNRACSSRTGEYWPLVVAVQTSLRSVRTATTSGQYSPVRPSRLVSKRLIFFLIPFLTSTLTFLLLCNRRLLKLYTFSDNVTSKHQYTPSKKLAENAQSGLSKKKKKRQNSLLSLLQVVVQNRNFDLSAGNLTGKPINLSFPWCKTNSKQGKKKKKKKRRRVTWSASSAVKFTGVACKESNDPHGNWTKQRNQQVKKYSWAYFTPPCILFLTWINCLRWSFGDTCYS